MNISSKDSQIEWLVLVFSVKRKRYHTSIRTDRVKTIHKFCKNFESKVCVVYLKVTRGGIETHNTTSCCWTACPNSTVGQKKDICGFTALFNRFRNNLLLSMPGSQCILLMMNPTNRALTSWSSTQKSYATQSNSNRLQC